MRVIKVPYPPPKTLPQAAEQAMVDFPERHLAYIIYDCKPADFERCALEVRKAVGFQSPGKEPDRLEIRFPDSN